MKSASDVSHFALSVTALLVSPIVVQSAAFAQAAQQTTPARSEDLLQEVVVIGSRAEGRTVTETSVPVDVFDSSVLNTQAPADMNNVLRNLVPSFNVAQFPLSDGSSFIRPPNLRGLPPDEILVLINGKRRHRAALVQIFGGSLASGAQGPDLAQIPTIAVDRIEVLRDGAAAQYGSDAIAGVINYSLKRGSDGMRITTRYGEYARGDGENLQIAGNIGLPLGQGGFVNVSVDHYGQEKTAPGGQRVGAHLLSQQRPDLRIENPANSIGDPKISATRGFVNAGLPIGDSGEAYVFGNYGVSESEIAFNWRQPVTLLGPDKLGNGNSTTYSRAGQFNDIYLDQLPDGRWDAAGRTFNFASMYPGGFAPQFKGDIEDKSIVAGYKGKTGFDLNFDFSAGYGQNSIEYTVGNTMNPSMGPDSPTSFKAGALTQTERNLNADFSFRVDAGLASPLTIAFGGEHRTEGYEISAGEPDSYRIGRYYYQVLNVPDPANPSQPRRVSQSTGSNGFPGFGPNSIVDNDRDSWAIYLDTEADLVERLTASAAIRHEDFSDFGTTTNYKATLRFEVNETLALRGAASTGFRAPTPGQLYTSIVSTGFSGADPIETASLPPTHTAARYFGGVSLQPEESTNYSVGFVLTPTSMPLTLTVDAYQIKVTDRIGFTQYFTLTQADKDALAALGVPGAQALGRVQYFTNGFATETRGLDVVLNHNMSTAFGRFQTTLAGNYNANEVLSADPGILSRERIGNIENMNPKIRVNLSEVWTLNDFTVLTRAAFADHWADFAEPVDGGDKTFGSEVTFDMELAYQVTDSIRLAVGGENIFDNYPDKNRRAIGLNGPAPTPTSNWYSFTDATVAGNRYPSASPIGINGAFYYARASFDF